MREFEREREREREREETDRVAMSAGLFSEFVRERERDRVHEERYSKRDRTLWCHGT